MGEYRSDQHKKSRPLLILFKYPDDDEKISCEIPDGIPPCQIRFDIFRNLFLKESMMERKLKNDCQSCKQQEMYEWKLAKEQQDKEAEFLSTQRYFNQGPYEEHQNG